MKDFFLSAEQVNELRAAHRAEHNRQAVYKINAVIFYSVRDGRSKKLRQCCDSICLNLRRYGYVLKAAGILTT